MNQRTLARKRSYFARKTMILKDFRGAAAPSPLSPTPMGGGDKSVCLRVFVWGEEIFTVGATTIPVKRIQT